MTPAAEYLTVEQFARELQVSVETVRRIVRRGELEVVRIGRRIRIARDSAAIWRSRQVVRRGSQWRDQSEDASLGGVVAAALTSDGQGGREE